MKNQKYYWQKSFPSPDFGSFPKVQLQREARTESTFTELE